jgi:hypothetical protein
MRNAQGYATITGPEGTKESDTFTCFHCQQIVHVKPMMDAADLGGLCKVCKRLICSRCVGGTCTPFEGRSTASATACASRKSFL